MRVFATVYPLADLARQIGGDRVTVEFAIESGQSLAGYQPSQEVRQKLTSAELVITGGTTEPWAVADATSVYNPQRVLRLDAMSPGGRAGLEWLDPDIARRAADEVARRLSLLRPNQESYFFARAEAFQDRIAALNTEYAEKFRDARRRRVIALSHDFDPLANKFDVDIVHVAGVTPERIGETQILQLRSTSREEHLVTLIIRADTPTGLVKDLADRTGFRVFLLDAYGSSAATGRNTYEGLLRYDMEQLLRAVQANEQAGEQAGE